MAELTMPRLSDTMESGTVGRWLKKVGDRIERGDIVLEVETDKANMEVEAYEAGVLEQILVKEGETAPIGQPIAVIGDGSGSAKAQPAVPAGAGASVESVPAVPDQGKPAPAAPPQQRPGAAAGEGGRVKASPLARRMAEEYSLDLGQIQGSGPGGRIVRADVEEMWEQKEKGGAAASVAPSAPEAPARPAGPVPGTEQAPVAPTPAQGLATGQELVPLSRMQQTVARRLTASKQTVPHFYVSTDIDMTDLLAFRQQLNAKVRPEEIKVGVNDLLVKACAIALERYPEVNSGYREGNIIRNSQVNIGVAVDVPNGLIVPVVRQANSKGVRQIAREAKGLIEKARMGKLTPPDYDGGTFTVSNLGMFAVSQFIAVINPPESAILAVGSIRKQMVVVNDEPAVRSMMNVTLSADHRVIYGAAVARFLQEVKTLLEDPLSLLG